MENKDLKKYILLAIIVALAAISFLIIKPFIGSLLMGMILAFLFYPLYKKFKKVFKYPTLASILLTWLIILLFTIPLFFMFQAIVKEIILLYNNGGFTSLITSVSTILSSNPTLDAAATGIISKLQESMTNFASSFIVSLPGAIFNILITLFTTFFIFITGEDLLKNFKKILPFKNKDEVINSVKLQINSIIYGFFVISIIGFIISIIGFSILGIGAPILWSLIIALAIMLPFVGPTIIWIPYAIVLFIQGNISVGIGMVILGTILSLMETFGRPYIIGKKAKVNPIVILFGVLGGIVLLGIPGIVLGPIILSLTFTFLESITQNEATRKKSKH